MTSARLHPNAERVRGGLQLQPLRARNFRAPGITLLFSCLSLKLEVKFLQVAL
jgi:hypothetical protein